MLVDMAAGKDLVEGARYPISGDARPAHPTGHVSDGSQVGIECMGYCNSSNIRTFDLGRRGSYAEYCGQQHQWTAFISTVS